MYLKEPPAFLILCILLFIVEEKKKKECGEQDIRRTHATYMRNYSNLRRH